MPAIRLSRARVDGESESAVYVFHLRTSERSEERHRKRYTSAVHSHTKRAVHGEAEDNSGASSARTVDSSLETVSLYCDRTGFGYKYTR